MKKGSAVDNDASLPSTTKEIKSLGAGTYEIDLDPSHSASSSDFLYASASSDNVFDPSCSSSINDSFLPMESSSNNRPSSSPPSSNRRPHVKNISLDAADEAGTTGDASQMSINNNKLRRRPLEATAAEMDCLDESVQTVPISNKTHRGRKINDDDDESSSRHLRDDGQEPMFSALRHAPDEKHWNSPVSWRHPRTITRKVRLVSGRMVENPTVQITVIVLIVLNALMMGIATFDFVTDDPNMDRAFWIADTTLLAIFTLELVLQLIYRGLSLFLDGWLLFDFVIIVSSWSLASTQVIRAFRIFRAVRLVTRIGPLRELISAIGAVMPRMYAISMLLLLIFYIYAVLFTQLFGDMELSENYFGTLTRSLFTCMELMTLEWSHIAREVMAERQWAWLPFLSYIAITGFIVFNLIVAVVCDAVAVIERTVKAEHDGPVESDADKLLEAQERIYEMSEQITRMHEQHFQMSQAMGFLADELKRTVDIVEKFHETVDEATTMQHTDIVETGPSERGGVTWL